MHKRVQNSVTTLDSTQTECHTSVGRIASSSRVITIEKMNDRATTDSVIRLSMNHDIDIRYLNAPEVHVVNVCVCFCIVSIC